MREPATMYYDRQGNPLTLDEWVELGRDTLDNVDYKRVGATFLQSGDHKRAVSTIWLGLNHAFGMNGPPLIFETMIFDGDSDTGQWRYETEAQAIEGHAQAVFIAKGQLSIASGGEPVIEIRSEIGQIGASEEE
jgi:hypothetical protein